MSDPSDLILLLRGQVAAIKETRKEVTPGMALEEVIQAGELLWTLIDEAKEAARVIRDVLREESGCSPGRFDYKTQSGAKASVHVHPPRPVMRKGVDITGLRQLLGPKFETMYNVAEQVTPVEDFADKVARMDPHWQKVFLDTVDIVTPKARVSFNNEK